MMQLLPLKRMYHKLTGYAITFPVFFAEILHLTFSLPL